MLNYEDHFDLKRWESYWIAKKKSTRRQKVVTITRINEQHKAIECMKFGKYVFIFDSFQVSNVQKKSEEEEEKKMNDRNDSYLLRMWFYLLLDICSLWKVCMCFPFMSQSHINDLLHKGTER